MTGLMGLPDGAKVLFITLTSVGRPGFAFLMKAWVKLLARLRRRYGAKGYVCKKEAGKRRGMQHLHILLVSPAGRIPHSYICQEWYKLTGAYIAWLRDCPVDGNGGVLAQYLAKYLGKGEDAKVWRKEVTYSADWPKSVAPRFTKLDYLLCEGDGRWWRSGPDILTRSINNWPLGKRWMASGLNEVISCPVGECFGQPLYVDSGDG